MREVSEQKQIYEPCNFKYKKIFGEAIRKFIFNLLKEAYISLMQDKKVNIDKSDELKCTAQLVYFTIKLRDKYHYPFLIHTEILLNDFKKIVYGSLSPKSSPRIDIKISRNDWAEESFLSVECKRLDSGSTLANKYVNEGMGRFISGKYCLENNCSFMVGFIIQGNNKDVVEKIDKYIENKYTKSDKLNLLEKELHYFSQHKRQKGHSPFRIHHLLANIDKLNL